MDKKFGDKERPLLVSVRSGARDSMPGMMDTILNLGMNDKVVEIVAKSTNNPRFAGQSHYGVWNRLFASFYDLLAVRWMKKRMFRYQVAERSWPADES